MEPTIFTTLAWYNRQVNREIGAILVKRDALAGEPNRTYFGSILDLLRHIVSADLIWLRRTAVNDLPSRRFLDGEERFLESQSGFTEWQTARRRIDDAIEEFAAALTPELLTREIAYTRSNGETCRERRWQCLLHMFNHQTHHRGQIAQVLDQEGVANDYSNLIWYLRDDSIHNVDT